MNDQIKTLVENKDYEKLRSMLSDNPAFANAGITIPYDSTCRLKAHPLHRICDAVFAKRITDEEAIKIAKIFLEAGANINGTNIKENEDTPLLAAASLHAEQLGIFYIDNGADIHYKGRHDGATALHWAAFCGRDKLVEKLIGENAALDLRDRSYNSSPIGWAAHTLITNDKSNIHHQMACVKLLLQAGADRTGVDTNTIQFLQSLAKDDMELQQLLV